MIIVTITAYRILFENNHYHIYLVFYSDTIVTMPTYSLLFDDNRYLKAYEYSPAWR